VITGLEKSTPHAMGVRSTHEIACLRTTQAHSPLRHGPGADCRLLAEHVPYLRKAQVTSLRQRGPEADFVPLAEQRAAAPRAST
jgi:hypothetical protein